MSDYLINLNVLNDDVAQDTIRGGFGRGLKAAGEANDQVVALCADLTESFILKVYSNSTRLADLCRGSLEKMREGN